ncbi:MAG: nicotinate phosphoribosyltransferase [Rectinema sp.]|nr:nicotinate phosphoribosyltransferase [Rectinema sp.]
MNNLYHSALFTDFYELTMAQGYWKRHMTMPVVFDYFFRKHPFSGGSSIFAGLGTLVESLLEFSFSNEDIDYLSSLDLFEKGFLDFLKNFRFRGTVYAAREGEVVFPQEPLLRVEADLITAQIVEGLVLNILNFQSLIATKAARIWKASRQGRIMEFGLRRAQGADGALSASRAAFIGGAAGTSNTLAGKVFGIPVLGTMAHSWIMSYPSELEAFEAYADIYPRNTVFLIDTYNSLESGIVNAIEAGRKLKERGYSFGVRLDSGDIDYLSRMIRSRLDEAGLNDVKIIVSNELNEEIIESLVDDKAPIDVWGVGTNLVTGGTEAAFAGVYKLSCIDPQGSSRPVMKFSDNPEKSTNPGVKNLWRLYDEHGAARLDLITCASEDIEAGKEYLVHHPSADWRQLKIVPGKVEPLLRKVMENGVPTEPLPDIRESQAYMKERIVAFDSTYLRILNPHIYKVSISDTLYRLKVSLIDAFLARKLS